MVRIRLTIPKRTERSRTQVTATLEDWTVHCDDASVLARLEAIKPQWTRGYLPPPTVEWAHKAEQTMHAQVLTFEQTDGPEIPGMCFSGGPLLNMPIRAEAEDGTIGDGVLIIGPGHPNYKAEKRWQARVQRAIRPQARHRPGSV